MADGAGVSLADGCAKEATGFCAFMKKCNPIGFAVDFVSDADCEAADAKRCAFYSVVADANRSGDDAVACGAVYSAKSCTDSPRCAATGTRATGAACQFSASCQSGLCIAPGADQCGICADYAPNGSACGGIVPCDFTKSYCDFASGKCTAYAGSGAPCIAGHTSCGPDLFCVNGTCAIGVAIGATCSAVAPCDFGSGAVCDGTTKMCTPVTLLPAGATCAGGAFDALCSAGGCVPNDGGPRTCGPAPMEGAACDPKSMTTPRCASFLECNSTGKCGFPEDLACK